MSHTELANEQGHSRGLVRTAGNPEVSVGASDKPPYDGASSVPQESAKGIGDRARSLEQWLKTVLPETRSAVVSIVNDRATVLAADEDLTVGPLDTFALRAESPLHAVLGARGVRSAPLDAHLRRQLPWSSALGERLSTVTCVAVPEVDAAGVLAVFHSPATRAEVKRALQSLAGLLAAHKPRPEHDPAVYALISKAKRDWELTVDALDELVFLLDRSGVVLRANRTVERWGFGDVSSVRGRLVHDVLHGECKQPSCRLQRLLACRWKQVRGRGSASFQLFDTALGKALQLTLQPIPQTDADGHSPDSNFGVVVISDVTALHQMQRKLQQLNDDLEQRVQARTAELLERNRDLRAAIARREAAERSLDESRNELARLSAQLLNTQEAERKRIALELHDSVGQSLSALKYSLERFVSIRGHPDLGDGEEALASCIRQLQQAIDDTRAIAMSLRPSLLDDMGVASAVSWLCRSFGQTYVDIHVLTDIRLTDAEVPPELGGAIFRIVQEALNNVAKHSHAHNVLVMMRRAGPSLSVEVHDDGVGFDLGYDAGRDRHRLGLVGMRERASMTGGVFSIVSGPETSTRVRVDWEVRDAESAKA